MLHAYDNTRLGCPAGRLDWMQNRVVRCLRSELIRGAGFGPLREYIGGTYRPPMCAWICSLLGSGYCYGRVRVGMT